LSNLKAPDRLVFLGEVVRTHGLKGSVRIRSHSGSAEVFRGLKEIWLQGGAGHGGAPAGRPLKIEWLKPHPRGVILKLAGLDSLDKASLVVGAQVGVPREVLPEPGEKEYYWADLVGLRVERPDGGEVGKVRALFETGANDVLVIESEEGEVLVPAVEAAIDRVDLENGIIRLSELEGLLD